MNQEQMMRIQQAAQKYGINPDNAQQVLALVTQARQNPASYPQVAEQARAMGFDDIPPTFDAQTMKAVALIAQYQLSAQPEQQQSGRLEQMNAQGGQNWNPSETY